MLLLVPLLIMLGLLVLAWGFGWLARGRGRGVLWGLAIAGLALLFGLPTVYDIYNFDGNCYGLDGVGSPCTLAEHVRQGLELGIPFMVPPALLWTAAFVYSARQSR